MKYGSAAESHTAGFALGYLFAMAEMGLYCPLCMTDGVARVLTRFGTREQIERRIGQIIAAKGLDYAVWGCVGSWYSGGWYDSGAQNYINSVKSWLAAKTWASY